MERKDKASGWRTCPEHAHALRANFAKQQRVCRWPLDLTAARDANAQARVRTCAPAYALTS
eukprot:134602-Pleurochrysis_carterae.AAC.1